MRTMSPAFRRAIFDGRADYTNYLEFTFADDSTLSLDNDNIMMDGCKMEDAVSDDNVFQVGAVIVGSATFTLVNMDGSLTDYPFIGAQVVWYIGMNDLDDGTDATIGNGAVKMGTFYVDETDYDGHIITLRCLDNAGKLDIPFVWPYSVPLDGMCSWEIGNWISKVSSLSGVSIPNAWTFTSSTIPYEYGNVAYSSIESATCRQVLSWVLQLCGRFARCNANGQLVIGWFDMSALTPSGSLYGGYFDETEESTYQSGDDADGGSFNPWNTGYAADGGDFTTYQNIDMIHNCFSQKLDMSDITITGVRIVYKTGDGGSSGSVAEATTGTGDYMISIEDNPFISGAWGMYPVNCALSWIGASVIGMKFRAGEVVHPSDPAIEAGDVGYYWDTHGNQHSILISSTEFKCGVTQRTVSSAASKENNASTRYSNSTKNYSEIMGIINASYIQDQLSGVTALMLNGNRAVVSPANNVEVLTFNGNPNPYMEIRGTVIGTWGVTAWASDKRLKDNITLSDTDALRVVNSLQVSSFDWKKDGSHVDVGLVADQVEEVMPDAVLEIKQPEGFDIDSIKQIDGNKLIPYCIKAIQELSSQVNVLKKKVNALEKAADKGA